MLERNATGNKELYIAQLHHVKEAIRLKRPHRDHTLSRQCQAPCYSSRQSHTPKARMGGPSTCAVFSGPCTGELPSFPLPVEPYEGCYIRQCRGTYKVARELLQHQTERFLTECHPQIGRELVGNRSKQQLRIHN
ncbi:hypothetical protein TNIN_93451 [Trichonephila inaurata madagascariensis]|uniref:Uncharacterized protein n=1 Tax=Trichonephila inaurata madagascariensis TaxID=2747483 RepID=A0A8X7C7K5_9ARAC|nr:hypothetical protein TNIN_93451 [Trichonephila inaurata madagascariensis]